MQEYDSKQDTLDHIARVDELLRTFSTAFIMRGRIHDDSKLGPIEKPLFDEFTPKLKDLTYGSDEYTQCLKDLKPALTHHYANNSHHPEHFKDGIRGMTLFDIVEMFCDWIAATERHGDGNIIKSLEINQKRFKFSNELKAIFYNTVIDMRLDPKIRAAIEKADSTMTFTEEQLADPNFNILEQVTQSILKRLQHQIHFEFEDLLMHYAQGEPQFNTNSVNGPYLRVKNDTGVPVDTRIYFGNDGVEAPFEPLINYVTSIRLDLFDNKSPSRLTLETDFAGADMVVQLSNVDIPDDMFYAIEQFYLAQKEKRQTS